MQESFISARREEAMKLRLMEICFFKQTLIVPFNFLSCAESSSMMPLCDSTLPERRDKKKGIVMSK